MLYRREAALTEDKDLVREYTEPMTGLVIWGRGLAKSTSLEFSALLEGAIMPNAFGIYLSSTQDKVNEHIKAIRDAIEASEVGRYYPRLANPRVGKFGNQIGWRQEAVFTGDEHGGFAIVGAGLDKGVRGLKDVAQRPTIFFLDDLDERDDTPITVDKKIKTLKNDVLPMRASGMPVLTIFAQNLIHRGSIMTKALRRETDMFSYRRVFGPVNTFADDLEIEKRDDRRIIVAGTPNWKRMGRIEAQALLDDIGEDAFRSECQNQMDVSRDERVLGVFEEEMHVITWSQFEKFFGTRKIPKEWEIHVGQDWGTTGPSAHPAVMSLVAVASENTALPGAAFLFWARTSDAGESSHQIARRLIEELPNYVWHGGARTAKAYLWQSDQLDERHEEEEVWALRRLAGGSLPLTSFHMSHEEAKGEQLTYKQQWGMGVKTCDYGKMDGRSQLVHYLEPEKGRRHPFKNLPTGEPLIGCPSMFFVVDDEQMQDPVDDKGLKRHRDEALTLRWDLNVAGRDVPVKRGDDAYDSLRMIFSKFRLKATPLSEKEALERMMPEGWRLLNAPNVPVGDWQMDSWLMARDMKMDEVKKERGKRFQDLDNPWENASPLDGLQDGPWQNNKE